MPEFSSFWNWLGWFLMIVAPLAILASIVGDLVRIWLRGRK